MRRSMIGYIDLEELITTYSERLVANSLTPPVAQKKHTSDSKVTGNLKRTSWNS